MSSPTQVGPVFYPAGYDKPVASLLRYLMQKIVETYDKHGVDLPSRRVITMGSVAVDDALLAVMFGGVAVGPPGNEMNTPLRGEAPRSATVNVELWRYAASLSESGLPPTAEQISETAEAAMNDTWILLEAAYASDQLGVGIIANVSVNEPNGQLEGVSMALEMQIP